MINAKEASDIATKAILTNLEWLADAIQINASKGERSIVIPIHDITKSEVLYLRDIGYKVESSNSTDYTISWYPRSDNGY